MSILHRTQILLPKELRQQVEKARIAKGLSLGAYVREAVTQQLKHERVVKDSLQKLADTVVGSVKKSSWDEKQKIVQWQREIRKDR